MFTFIGNNNTTNMTDPVPLGPHHRGKNLSLGMPDHGNTDMENDERFDGTPSALHKEGAERRAIKGYNERGHLQKPAS